MNNNIIIEEAYAYGHRIVSGHREGESSGYRLTDGMKPVPGMTWKQLPPGKEYVEWVGKFLLLEWERSYSGKYQLSGDSTIYDSLEEAKKALEDNPKEGQCIQALENWRLHYGK
jgi:hypothetical protein